MSFATLCALAAIADKASITVLKINDASYMAVIQPSIKLAEKYPQLASALQVTAPPDQLGAEVEKAITHYRPVLETAISNLSAIEQELQDAQKAAREKGKTKTTPAKAPAAGTTTSVAKPGEPMAKVASSSKPAPPDLFGGAPAGGTTGMPHDFSDDDFSQEEGVDDDLMALGD